MDFKNAFTYMFKDNNLGRVFLMYLLFIGLPFGIMLVINTVLPTHANSPNLTMLFNGLMLSVTSIVLSLFASITSNGWYCLLIRNASINKKAVLPDCFNDFKTIWSMGSRFIVATFLFVFALFGIALALGLISLLLHNMFLVFLGCILLFIPIIFYFIFFSGAIAINFVISGKQTVCFQFKKNWEIVKSNLPNYILMLLITFGCAIALGVISHILALIPVIGFILSNVFSFVGGFYGILVIANLMGQFCRQYLDKQAPVYNKQKVLTSFK